VSYEDLPCVDFVELVTDYLEGVLPTEQVLVVERHLAFCAPCVDYLDQIRATMRATGAIREEDVPEPLMDTLLEAFREFSGEPE
jgi:anti-sigma factor RsiW